MFQTKNLNDSIQKAVAILGERYGFTIGDSGRELFFEETNETVLTVTADKDKVIVKSDNLASFYRGVGLAVQKEQEGELEFCTTEEICFDFNGLMLDCSRNGVVSIPYAKELIERMAIMGHRVFMLYMEDTYEIDGEEYFGYLRGRYAKKELKELDDYAYQFGIELMPCIQTLAHLDQFFLWDTPRGNYVDIDNILYVGHEKVNALLDRMLKQLSETFRTKRIHIGMDEAYNLGRGRYATEHGLQPRMDIMKKHLDTTLKIAGKYGLRPIIWDDMFIHNYIGNKEEAIQIPDEMDLMYWDYYNNTEVHYADNFDVRDKISDHVMFAGGIWRWIGYAPHHSKTYAATNASLAVCKRRGIREVLATSWADDGCECPVSTVLFGLALFAEHGYHKDFSEEAFKKRLFFYTGKTFESYLKQEEFDILPEFTDRTATVTPSKYLFYEDPLVSIFVYHTLDIKRDLTPHYQDLAKYFEEETEKESNPAMKAASGFYAAFANVLALKWNLGLNLYQAYQKKDKAALKDILDTQIVPLIPLMDELSEARKKEWNSTNRNLGYEVLDLRYGGIKQRLHTTKSIISEYLDGTTSSIEELEETRIEATHGREAGIEGAIHFNSAQKSMTAGRMLW